ncbi:hypothetical protein A3B02_02280 [Candidatus Roizmanbacteria bacterium RIFCSPLOWO2_01_FULL_42_14]|uniref:Uncharacterized protein n=3 Tax=Candidatus Roizmaniibacteriota TaxID=1752723 RepID=A0A1F7JXG0_9BACT|nr:MAG: hypothetical protein A3D08_01195 [Candidatus Roizmanbacteria bacterium RIFCSPHIGHO2_02_FULL_43_11]OGK51950.1 MAG: hypothetical protein A3B02_02280 [Candidatus Roizmanbacteria bacterium RIFCSPLOWO2_01_FULL_42_14]OGK60299.1 MAG: hypothetical protein A3I56_04375 [Candidatus Roizmanbacteria bacterium RIFCSPLOWO2_02_FULL_43_10]
MPETDRVSYWLERFLKDAKKLSHEQRLDLTVAYLVHFCSLTPDEVAFFSDESFFSSAHDIDKTLIFARIEQKLAAYYGAGYPDPNTDEYSFLATAAAVYSQAFSTILAGIYSTAECAEIASLIINPWDWGEVRAILVGKDFFLARRIRNAYLPEITDCYVVTGDGSVYDIDLFDRPDQGGNLRSSEERPGKLN